MNLSDPTAPVYDYPASTIGIEDFTFDIEQSLSIGSEGSGAGAGKVMFNEFQITKKTDSVSGKLFLVNASGVLETITINFAGINTDTFASGNPQLLNCGSVPCAFESFSFTGIAPDPTVSFSVMSGTADIAFSVVPEPSTWAMMLLGFAGLGFAGYRASRRTPSAA